MIDAAKDRATAATRLVIQTPHFPLQPAMDCMRRLGDILIASALLVFALPLLLIVGLAIRCESPGPILERQSCIARGGRRFDLLRFRITEYSPAGTRTWNRQSTHVGQFLCYTRIDRLPELINVLRGEISFLEPDRYSPSFLE